MQPMVDCLISVGSNVGSRETNLREACDRLARCPCTTLVAVSPWHETRPIGGCADQAPFLNGAVRLQTELSPSALLERLQQIETQLGRVRLQRWGPRTVDLDLLLYGTQQIERPGLQVPHPRMAFRRFVIDPAVEIAPDMWHPTLGWTIDRLATHLRQAINYVAIAGPPHVGKTSLARNVAQRLGLRLLSDPLSGSERCVLPDTSHASQTSQTSCASNAPTAEGAGTLQAELARLEQRAAPLVSLEPATAGAETSWAVIGDYWFDQSLGEALPHLQGRERCIFYQAWLELRRSVVPPKLLIVLDPTVSRSAGTLPRSSTWPPSAGQSSSPPTAPDRSQTADHAAAPPRTPRDWHAWRASVAPLAGQLGRGPVLWLDARRPDEALIEALAAVEAMRPPAAQSG